MTRRSRSSFDLRDALTTAEALSPKPPATQTPGEYEGLPLVAFGGESVRPAALVQEQVAPPVSMVPKRVLTPPPEVGSISGLIPRLSALMDWLRSDQDISRVIVVDDEGLPLIGSTVGDLSDAESLLAATGSVASAMKRLALATPGALSRDFEGHVGDGPVLQLVGLSSGSRAFVVGISRRAPLPERDVETVRAAFVKALSAGIAGAALTTRGGTGRAGDT